MENEETQVTEETTADETNTAVEENNTDETTVETDKKTESELRRARGEAAKYRTRAREAEDANSQLIDKVGRALGLITDEKDEKPTVEALTAQLQESQARASQAEIELAVYRTAGKHGLDADLALDSRAFTESLKNIDLSNADALAAHVAEWVRDHPHHAVKTSRVGANTVEHAAGSDNGLPKTQAEFDSLTYGEMQELYLNNRAVYERFTR